jgi:aerobic carbon-monoxide dehydrogenase medium subunit
MKPAPFQYVAPSTLQEALDIMNQHGNDAKLLAGGQSLIPVLNFRLANPRILVDLNNVNDLQQLESTGAGGLRIGAMVRQSQLEQSDTIAQYAPLVQETMPHIAHPQIRNRGTVGGSLAHADPAAELPVIMVALQAQFRLRKTGGDRWINAEDFYQSLFTTALESDEILVEIAIPPLPRHCGYAFMEIARRHGDYAQAGVAALVQLDESGICRQARLVYMNVGEVPMVARQAASALAGHVPSAELVADIAANAAQNEIDPTGDIHATADYRRHLSFVLGRRAILRAVSRAREGWGL